MSNAATDLAEALGARAILVATATGRTASEIARLRPRRPMVGLSHHQTAVQQMALEWGVLPLLMPSTADVEDLWVRTIETARAAGIIDHGDLVVLIAGTAVNLTGSTNVIKVDARQPERPEHGRGAARGVARAKSSRRDALRPDTCLLAAAAGLVLVGVLYWKPIHSYEHTRAVLQRREAEVSRLETQQRQLKARIATVGTGQELVREARRLGFVKPGEQLFIVRGIAAWRAGHRQRPLTSGDGRSRGGRAAARAAAARVPARRGALPVRRAGRRRAGAVRRRRRRRSRRSSG